jgi:hypothetical protein
MKQEFNMVCIIGVKMYLFLLRAIDFFCFCNVHFNLLPSVQILINMYHKLFAFAFNKY